MAERRHDLDWLRVIAFGLLILYHVALGFVPWAPYPVWAGEQIGAVAQMLMSWMHIWRLPLLFLVSGMATAYAFASRTPARFAGQRLLRLGVPLLFGMLILNAISVKWFFAGIWPQFLAWWLTQIGKSPQLQHLWFLINLVLYSVLLFPLMAWAKAKPGSGLIKALGKVTSSWGIIFIWPLGLLLIEVLVKPWSRGERGQGYELWWYLAWFALGWLAILVKDRWFDALVRARWVLMDLAVVSAIGLVGVIVFAERMSDGYSAVLLNGGWAAAGAERYGFLQIAAIATHLGVAWFTCLALAAWAARLLNRPDPMLAELNRGVFCFYLVHMAAVLGGLLLLKKVLFPLPWNLIALMLFTAGVCAAAYLLAKRTRATRLLFGIKDLPPSDRGA